MSVGGPVTKSLKFGFEGEGPMIGRRTAYASYPAVSPQVAAREANLHHVDSLYYVVDSAHRQFVDELLIADLGAVKVVTVDYPVDHHSVYGRLAFAIRFIRCDHLTDVEIIPSSALNVTNTYVKMVCEDEANFQAYVTKANEIAAKGHTVLLMPDFDVFFPQLLGAKMMEVFDLLHARVRVCPPVHHVLGTP
jgi:hypothetical protein